ncbi:MAG: methylated-DNA--[protein]-cysteine S-methyltransferase [Candidatus Marinimicrobia bacterium]|nr:methylated-DNA--[protein]-cysteine S-methyltransferase [Candidatus Neomarinimicrobiota bacterium]
MIQYSSANTPVGLIYLAQHGQELCSLALGIAAEAKLLGYLADQFPGVEVCQSEIELIPAVNQLNEYFAGERTSFELPIRVEGTDFQRKVWRELLQIPYGVTRSYGEIANKLGSPGGMRAVGAANGQNPLPIIVPCHRVIAADGSLGGYTGGLDIKHKLLELERQKFTPTLF